MGPVRGRTPPFLLLPGVLKRAAREEKKDIKALMPFSSARCR